MKLRDIVPEDASFDARFGTLDITGISVDSRAVKSGELFVAVPGTKADGLAFVPQALKAGAAAIMAEKPPALPDGIAFVQVPNVRRALALAAAKLHPRQPKTIAAVTGTSGKTSVAAFTRQIWTALGMQPLPVDRRGGTRMGQADQTPPRRGPLVGADHPAACVGVRGDR
jgi:UDP-N-acetylmuramoyl-L-alanyl-D-glutamate--2,6-diaminopimelate ligase